MNRRHFLQHIPIFVLPLAVPIIGCKTTGTDAPTKEEIGARIRAIAHLASYLSASGVKYLASQDSPEALAAALAKLNQARKVADNMLLTDNLSLGTIANALKAAGIGDTNTAQGDMIVDAINGILLIVDVYGWVEFNPDIQYHVRAALVGIRDGLYTVVGPLPESTSERNRTETMRDLETEVTRTAQPFVNFWNRRKLSPQ